MLSSFANVRERRFPKSFKCLRFPSVAIAEIISIKLEHGLTNKFIRRDAIIFFILFDCMRMNQAKSRYFSLVNKMGATTECRATFEGIY